MAKLAAPSLTSRLNCAGRTATFDFAMSSAASESPTNLVPPLTALIGRADALARIEQLLRSQRRLITLLGPAGIGKTRLALAIHPQIAGMRFRGGIWFCDLSAASSLAELCRSVAAVLAVELQPDEDPLQRLGRQLAAAGELVLILDNAEQVADATAAAVACWLGMSAGLRCIVTSRERLRLAGEAAYELAPLADAEAVELFVERARDARDGFELRDGERTVVAQIAQRLDGVPLAIELAAAQMVVQSPRALLARLRDRLALLDAGVRNASARQATLRGAIDWSWRLLSEPERAVLAQCAAFRGGFSLEAAEAVVVAPAPGPPLVNLLRALCDRSLMRRSAHEDVRGSDSFRLLSTVHEYARERLEQRSDGGSVLARHARFYLAFDDPARVEEEPGALRTGQPDLVSDNLLAIAERGGAADPAASITIEQALRALSMLAYAGAEPAAVLPGLDQALAHGAGVDARLLARARLARARLRLRDGQWSAARDDYQAALQATTEGAVRAAACCGLGNVHRQQGQRALARRAYLRALAYHDERADRAGKARILANLGGMAHEQGRLPAARELHEQALALYTELGDERGAAVVLHNAGLIIQEQGKLEEAEAIFLQAHRLHVASGHLRFEGVALFDLAGLYCERDLWAKAYAESERALRVLRAAGDRRLAALALSTRGACSAALGQVDAARADLEQVEVQLAAIDDRVFLQVVETQRGHLDLALALRAYASGADRECAAHLQRASARAGRGSAGPPKSRRRAAPQSVSDEQRLAARILRKAVGRHRELDRGLCVASDRSWLRGPGAERSAVSSKKVLRRILAAFVERRLSAPSSPLTPDELVRRGWPDERVASGAAGNRLQVALTQLRKLGLERALIRRADGYLIDPEIPLFVVDAA